MRKTLAIASIAVRNAVRSRVVASLLLILAVAMVALPLTLKGDGTPEGQVQILLNYTLGFTTLILSLASLWAGCAAVSTEIAEKQMQMVATKPVSHLQIWAGKWLGLMLVNGSLLLLAGATAYGLLLWRTGPGRFPDADRERLRSEVLVARRTIDPQLPDFASDARARFEERNTRGEVPTNVPPAVVIEAIRRQLVNEANTVPPGATKRWTFALPAGAPPGEPTLTFRFASSRIGPSAVAGLWMAGPPQSPGLHRLPATNIASSLQRVRFPADLARHRELIVDYVNTDPNAVSVVFDDAAGPSLHVMAGEFPPNYARALLVLLAHLGFMSALGVTAGSLFSMPVAAFLALCLLFVLQVSDYLAEASTQAVLIPWHQGAGRGPNWADEVLRHLFRGVHAAAAPLKGADTLGQLSTGQLVAWVAVADAVLLQMLLAGGLLALFGAFVFSRRELALHTS